MLLMYEFYYRRFGVRKLPQLISPPIWPIDHIQLPRSAIYHVYSHDPDKILPDTNDPIYRFYNKKIAITHLSELTSNEGNPKHISKPVKSYYQKWQLTNNARFRWSPEPEKIALDSLSLAVYNYGLLHKLYRYVELPMTNLYKWINLEKTMFANMSKLAIETHRHQFIVRNIPDALYPVGILNMLSNQNSIRTLRIFNTPEALTLLDLWRWINPEQRHMSVMSVLSKDAIPYINIILKYKDKFTVINLQKLDEWNSGIEMDDKNQAIARIKSMQLQRFILKMLLSIQTSAIDPYSDDEESEETNNEDKDTSVEINTDEKEEEMDDDIEESETTPEESQQKSIIKFPIVTNVSNKEHNDQIKMGEIEETDLIKTSDMDKLIEDVDEELKVLDSLSKFEDVEEDSSHSASITEYDFAISSEEREKLIDSILSGTDPVLELKNKLDQRAKSGTITAQNYRSLIKSITDMDEIKSPTNNNTTIREFIKLTEEDIVIDEEEKVLTSDTSILPDPRMSKSTLQTFNTKYIKKVLPKDIQSSIFSLAKAGVIVKDYDIEEHESALGKYEHHIVKIKPIDGAESTLHFRIPKVNEEGEFTIGGIKLYMRKQRTDLPIRKIDPITVALSSYYGKVFVKRSDRKQYDDMNWLCNQITNIVFAGGNEYIKKVTLGKVFDNNFKAPRIYSSLSMRFKYIDISSGKLVFDHTERKTLFPDIDLKQLEGNDFILCGKSKNNEPILIDKNNMFNVYRHNIYTPIGDIYKLVDISYENSPISFSELKIFSKSIPLGVVMSYYIGLSSLIKMLNCSVQIFKRNTRFTKPDDHYTLTFKNKVLLLDKKDIKATLLLAGFLFYKDTIKHHDIEEFDNKNVYLLLLIQRDLTVRYLKELDNLEDMFVDPMTKSILEEMKEPVTFKGLLLRSNELLTTSYHPDSNDMKYMRIRGYERMAGMLYKEITNAVRDYRSKNIQSKSQISISPYSVWSAIGQDQSVELTQDINPIKDIKESEAVTYVGSDGRAKDAMTLTAREYHVNDVGIMSESTVDSGDAGINTFTAANPALKSVRGLIDENYDVEKEGPVSLLSTSSMISPFSTNDDPKRANFISIQMAHTVGCVGYHQHQLRTGYENIIPYRAGKNYAYIATQDGRTLEITDNYVSVEYKDGSIVNVPIGKSYGRAEGSIYLHELITPLKPNSKFKKDDPIVYNSSFFEEDWMNPGKIVFKTSLLSKVAFMETIQTFEDANSISRKLSEKLTTKIVKERLFVLNFNQNIRNITPIGTQLKPKDILFIVEDPITSSVDVFDEDTIESLSRLSNLTPKAKVNGILDRYEVYYNGDLEDMSPSLRKLATDFNKYISNKTKNTELHIKNGRVNEEFGVEGKSLQLDTLVIKVYIVVTDKAMLGDKVVFANQLKSVTCEVMSYDMKTENGEEIDAVFSYTSVGNRITMSPLLLGTTSTLLNVVAKKAVEIYKK